MTKRHKRLPIPEYSVLHIGPEHNQHYDPVIIAAARKTFMSRLLLGFGVGVLFLTLMIHNRGLSTSLAKNDNYISSLIDEVGSLNQENFMLSERVESQETILQTIEGEFSGVLDSIEDAGGNPESIERVFGQFFSGDEVALDLNLDQPVTLASEDDTFDVLVLGTNEVHTDTIMVASINKDNKEINMISVPRDLYIKGRRINDYYTYYGPDQLERMIQLVTGLQIDQYIQVDLEGFVKIVDIVDGVEVVVEKTIYDASFPNSKGGYDPYYIEAGTHHMDGEAALRYARSRKSTSDFDRAGRQQVIISALRKKVEQLGGVLDMKELTEIFQAGLTHTETDISLLDAVSYFYDYKDYKLNTGFVLSTSNFLYGTSNQAGASILLPNGGSYDAIHKAVDELVN